MPEVALGLSVAEQDKIAAYHKAMEDRQIGVVNVAESVPADGGMAVTGEVPPGAMEPDQPMESLVAGLAPSAMPRPAMNAAATGESGVAVNEMPRSPDELVVTTRSLPSAYLRQRQREALSRYLP